MSRRRRRIDFERLPRWEGDRAREELGSLSVRHQANADRAALLKAEASKPKPEVPPIDAARDWEGIVATRDAERAADDAELDVSDDAKVIAWAEGALERLAKIRMPAEQRTRMARDIAQTAEAFITQRHEAAMSKRSADVMERAVRGGHVDIAKEFLTQSPPDGSSAAGDSLNPFARK